MKQIIPILAFLSVSLHSLYSQVVPDSTTVIYGWKLDKHFTKVEMTDIDTSLVNFQVHNPIYNYSINNAYLGNYGSPVISTVFFDRKQMMDMFALNQYMPYFAHYSNTLYINSRKPFTHLVYTNGGSGKTKEESIEVFHSQNINNKFNFGFNYKVISANAQYKYLGVKNHAFKFFSSYSGEKYKFYTTFDYNKYKANENGGIDDESFQAGALESKEIKTVFQGETNYKGQENSNAINSIRYLDFLISHQLKLFSIQSKTDSTEADKPSNVAEPILSHIVRFRRASKLYHDIDPIEPGFYENIYKNTLETYDSIAEITLINTLQLEFKTTLRNKVQAGIFGNINHEFNQFTYYTPTNLPPSVVYFPAFTGPEQMPGQMNYSDYRDIDNKAQFKDNIFISGGIYGKFWHRFTSEFNGTIYLTGYKAGQTKFDGKLNSKINILKNSYEFEVYGAIESAYPGYMIQNYYSNHFIWEKDFKPITTTHLSTIIGAPSNNFRIKGDYALISNFIYFNFSDSVPEAYGQAINMAAISLEKEFVLWKLHSKNTLVYQLTENENVISVPAFAFYNSTFIDHTWKFNLTGGELRTILGFDLYYNTKYKGYAYTPSLSTFSNQSEQIGNYPYIDVFLNVRLKRARFFVKYEHVNDSWFDRNYYLAIGYPANQSMFKWGLSWTFYD